MKKIIFLFLLFISVTISAQEEQNETEISTVISSTTEQKVVKTGDSIDEKSSKWLKSSGRKTLTSEKQVKKKASILYERMGYMASVNQYKLLDANELADRKAMVRMANSYRLNGRTKDAEYWYSHVAFHTENPEDLLHYAQVLHSNGKCEDAIRWYEKYTELADSDSMENRDFIENCDELAAFEKHQNVHIENMVGLNTRALDFSPIPFQGGLVFTSTRGRDRIMKNKDIWTNGNFSDLFYARMDDKNRVKKISPFEGDVNGRFHDGVATFDEGQSVMLFTRNNKKGKSKAGVIDLNIYMAYKHGDYWTDVKKLPFNDNEFATCHPSLSSDGDRLYFASNRKGGYGGMDLYVSIFDGAGWGEPINMGATINTAGNEVFPFFANDGQLYFASDGHRGIGGLDVFVASKAYVDDETTWNERKNLGEPFNSPKDDFGFYIHSDNTGGYLSSNRDGGQGGDDIYSWTGELNTEDEIVSRVICVSDEINQNMIDGAKVAVYEKDKEQQLFTSNKDGHFVFQATRGQSYKMVIEKDGYEIREITVTASELMTKENYCLELSKLKCQAVNGKVINAKYNNVLREAKVVVYNKCTGEKTEMMVRHDGTFSLCMSCGCDYTFEATKESFTDDKKMLSAASGNCGQVAEQELILALDLIEQKEIVKNEPPVQSQEISGLKTHFLGDPNGEFFEGQIITLKDIYYDYDKWAIRGDAGLRLNKIKQLLDAYPNMEIEMMSHTDSRGNNTYNSTLSSRRASSAMEYLVSRGVSEGRLTSKGYGESELVNKCKDGISCSEAEHQLNRRTEIRIRKI